jgi:hypothetical protein
MELESEDDCEFKCCYCIACGEVRKSSVAGDPSVADPSFQTSKDIEGCPESFGHLSIATEVPKCSELLAYECFSSYLRQVAEQFLIRDQQKPDGEKFKTVTAIEVWERIESQHKFTYEFRQLISRELIADSEIQDDRSNIKRSKDGLRRALHLLSDSCSHRHNEPEPRSASLLPEHYRAMPADFDAIGLGEQFAANSPLDPSVAARLNAALGAAAISPGTGLRDAAALLWQHVPGAGPRIARLLRAALDPAAPAGPGRWEALLAQAASAASCQEVSPGVYLGSYRSATDAAAMAALGVTRAVNCTAYRFAYPPAVAESARCAVDQDCYSCRQLRPALRALRRWLADGRRAIVHCVEGRFRSATLAAAWLMLREGLPPDDAAAAVRARRPWARPKRFVLRALHAAAAAAVAAGGGSSSLEDALLGPPK